MKKKDSEKTITITLDSDRIKILTIMFNICMGEVPFVFANALIDALSKNSKGKKSSDIYASFLKDFTTQVHKAGLCTDPGCCDDTRHSK